MIKAGFSEKGTLPPAEGAPQKNGRPPDAWPGSRFVMDILPRYGRFVQQPSEITLYIRYLAGKEALMPQRLSIFYMSLSVIC
jgi:hypothetical protein